MPKPLAFEPDLAFGHLNLLGRDCGGGHEIPSWLIDRPDVLEALQLLAVNGGTEKLKSASMNYEVALVHPTGPAITFMQLSELEDDMFEPVR